MIVYFSIKQVVVYIYRETWGSGNWDFFFLGDKLGKNFVSIYYLVGSFYPVDFLFLIFVYLRFKSHFLCFRNKDN